MSDSSSAHGAGRQRAQAYLGEMLELNPIWQSRQILQLRRETLKLPTAHPAAAEVAALQTSEHDESRERTGQRGREQLRCLQEKFYELSDKQLTASLDELTPERYPDVAPVVARLRVTAEHRQTLVALFHQPSLDSELVRTLGWVLVSPPSDAGYSREEYIQSLTSRKKVAGGRATAQYLAQHHPELFQLERDWLTTIAGLSKPSAGTLGESSWKIDWGTSHSVILFIIVLVVARLLVAFLGIQ